MTRKVLGIDPGYGRVGWAIVEGNRSLQKLVKYGCFVTASGLEPSRRLQMIYDEIQRLVKEFKPDEGVVEELFFFKNQKTVMQVGQARGVIVVSLVQAQVPVYEYTPLQVKQSVTGYGRAEKQQVQMMVKSILKLNTIPQPDDAADAVAVALTHFFMNRDLA